jgi:hypothetical protein
MVTVAVVVVLVAVVVVAALSITRGSATKPAGQQGVTTSGPAEQQAVAPAGPVVATRLAPAKRAEPTAEPAQATESEKVQPQPIDASQTADAATTDPEAIVKSLTLDQEQKLYQLLAKRQMERMQREMKYQLPSQWKLQMLAYQRGGELKLSDSQQKQVDAIKEGLKPRMDALLADNWARMDELNNQLRAAWGGAKTPEERTAARQQTEELYKELNQLREAADQVKRQLDQEFAASLRGVLTAEQNQAIDSMNAGFHGPASGGTFARPSGEGPAPKGLVPGG